MDKAQLKHRIDVAAGRVPADLVIHNGRIVDVYSATILEGQSIALAGGDIAGIGTYQGVREIDAQGQFILPGFIDGHIHIESSYVTPEELGRLLVPHGGTTIIADPHEIVNVCGLEGLDFMVEAAKKTQLDIRFMVPSCVPATPWEHAGAVVDAGAMENPMGQDQVQGLAEFMNYPGVIQADDGVLDKLMVAHRAGKPIDGHSPGIGGRDLNAYVAGGIHTDHECSTVEEMTDRLSRGLYILLREGSACHNLRALLRGVTAANSRRCVLCSDDRQAETILTLGHLDNHLQICVEEGIDPITAIQMASLNAAECFGLKDRGAIAPGLRADLVLVDDLKDFRVRRVFIQGQEVARDGVYLLPVDRADPARVRGRFQVKDFSVAKLRLPLRSGKVHVINILPGGVVTGKGTAEVARDNRGEFLFQPHLDVVKVAVVERHQNTGNVAVALLRGYGIRHGAIALSIAHDSHNIIAVGTNDNDMAFAVERLIAQGGGIVLAQDGQELETMPMVVAGLMSDQSGVWVSDRLKRIHQAAFTKLGVSGSIDPVMTLCFMSLAVIPSLKITDQGLFDVGVFGFISVEAD